MSFALYERMAIQRALTECKGDPMAAAKLLKVGKSTVYRQMHAFGIPPPRQGRTTTLAKAKSYVTTREPVSLEVYERLALERALDQVGGDRLAAAKLLRISRGTMYRKLVRHGLG